MHLEETKLLMQSFDNITNYVPTECKNNKLFNYSIIIIALIIIIYNI